jgi:hypothetical protein
MPALTEQEKKLLELMKQLEAADPVVEPRTARNQDFLPGFDDHGQPFPDDRPLPSAEQQAADNEQLIHELEAQLARRKREADERAGRGGNGEDGDDGDDGSAGDAPPPEPSPRR